MTRRLRWRGILAALATTALVTSVGVQASSADEYYTPQPNNGYKIFLSTADQSNQGCNGYIERSGSDSLAANAAYWLKSRGFIVRVGQDTYENNVAHSNAWGANAHIPIHTNAASNTSCVSPSPQASTRGTLVGYYSTTSKGYALSGQLRYYVGQMAFSSTYASPSPGTNDATTGAWAGRLYEIYAPWAPSAYLETEFHDWTFGTSWVTNYPSYIGKRIAVAVDAWLGYPPNK